MHQFFIDAFRQLVESTSPVVTNFYLYLPPLPLPLPRSHRQYHTKIRISLASQPAATHAQMDVPPPDLASLPPPATPGDDDDALAQARQIESISYHALVAEGGRPSHPLDLLDDIVTAPGPYRDILAFWQDRSDEWQVFNKQLSRWQAFRTHQRISREADRFPSYVNDLIARLKRHNFELPSGFSRHLDRQDGLSTWVEYLNYEFTKRDEYNKWLETCRPGYDEALAQLVESQVLQPFESIRTLTSDICRPSSIEITRRKEERRRAQEAYEIVNNKIHWKDVIGESQTRQQIETMDHLLVEAQNQLETINKRAYRISEFTRKTHPYRFALDRSERHELLLRWALDQVPLIEKEMKKGRLHTSGRASPPPRNHQCADQPTFPCFRHLPPEIRLRIWAECLPKQPSAHFFEVLNHQRKRHLALSWSSKEFRVRATTRRDSGYRVVYPLLAVCREARLAVEAYYERRSGCRRLNSQACNSDSSSRRLDFRTFDWIPADDLIVLCFPPIQVPHLPAGNAITIAHGPEYPPRRIGVLVPKELMIMGQFNPADDIEGEDDAAQLSLIPEFIEGLHRPLSQDQTGGPVCRGIKKLYLIVEGWVANHACLQATLGVDSSKQVDAWSDSRLSWHFDSARRSDAKTSWQYVTGCPDDDEIRSGEDDGRRPLWWLGSGNTTLGAHNAEDIVEKAPARRLFEFLDVLDIECDIFRWDEGFEGVEALGFMEPARGNLLKKHARDWMEPIHAQNDRPWQNGI